MTSVYHALFDWARRTTTTFAELLSAAEPDADLDAPDTGGMAYRLKNWPALPHQLKTAGVYRMLSVMSQRPVNRRWMLSNSGLSPAQLDRLVERLRSDGSLDVIDTSRFSGG